MKPKVIKITDSKELIPTEKYPHAKFPFKHFNPPQSKVFEHYDKPCNFIAAANTSSGKTIMSELMLAHEVRELGGKGIYLAPLKALTQEKIDDWTSKSHHFSDLKISIMTGDYKISADRQKELENADIIILTSEMLNSKARNSNSSNYWLRQANTLVCDESHILMVPNRGDHIESGIMKFTEVNPNARIMFLSATMPNVDEIGAWLSSLNGKDTYVLESTYRPCPLYIHYHKYQDQYNYEENERTKVNETIKLVEMYPSDKFILFVHTKRTGELLYTTLKELGAQCEYHNADLTKEKRVDIETRFRNDNKLRCLVATSTVAWGLNTPARRVVIVGVHRGLSEVETYDIAQMCGRSGRPQYDPAGDAYILLPAKEFGKQVARLKEPQRIKSQMIDNKCLAFHLTSEIHHRNIQSIDDIHDWYDRSLASHQNQILDEDVVKKVVKDLTRCGAVREEENTYETTSIGNVASMFYYSPFDVSDLTRNFTKLFEYDKENNDHWLAMALANIDSDRTVIASNIEKEEMSKFKKNMEDSGAERIITGKFTDGTVKIGCCYYHLLKGYNSAILNATMRGLQMDSERLCEVLCTLDQMTGKWNQREFFKQLYVRLLYGVGPEMIDLVRLRGIGKIKAKRLWEANLRTLEDISKNTLKVIKALNCSKNVAEEICHNAKEIMLDVS